MPSLTPPAELLRVLTAVLRALGVEWYVFGAQAVVYWGRPRFTEDIDVTVMARDVEISKLVATLQAAGFAVRPEGTADFIARTRVVPLLHTDTDWPLDLVIGGPGLEEDFLRRSVPVEIGHGTTVRMIAAEDLIATKILAGRPKDLEDVRGILAAQGATLRAEAVKHTLAMLEDALGVSDLIPTFERFFDRP